MKTKIGILVIVILCSSLITGCQTVKEIVQAPAITIEKTCDYESLSSPIYTFGPNMTSFASMHMFHTRDTNFFLQLTPEGFSSWNNAEFKVLETGQNTNVNGYTVKINKSINEYRFENLVVKIDPKFSTELIKSDCTRVYLFTDASIEKTMLNIKKSNKKELSISDLETLYGKDAFRIVNYTPKVTYDKFSRITTMESEQLRKGQSVYLIRSYIQHDKKHKPISSNLVLTAAMIGFGQKVNITHAYTMTGDRIELGADSTVEAFCPDSNPDPRQCRYVETSHFYMSLDYLKTFPKGLEMKFYGKPYPRILEIPKGYLDGIIKSMDKVLTSS